MRRSLEPRIRQWRGLEPVQRAALVGLACLLLLVVVDAGAATAVAAALALVGAAWTISHGTATARRTLTADYKTRWNQPALLGTRVVAGRFLRLADPADEAQADARWALWKEWNDLDTDLDQRIQIMVVLNFWETVSSAYNQGLLDEAWFRTDLAWDLKSNWDRASWFIRKLRSEYQDAAYFCEWQIAIEQINADVERQHADGKKRAESALAQGEDLLYVAQPRPGRD